MPHRAAGLLLAIALAIPVGEANGLTVSGQVRTRGAEELAGATVSLLPLSEPGAKSRNAEPLRPRAAVTTNGDGRFRLSVALPDFYRLRIEAPGFESVERDLTPLLDDLQLPVLELARTASSPAPAASAAPRPVPAAAPALRVQTGRLVSAADRTPVRRGIVWSAGHPAFFARSDEKGEFRLALPRRGGKAIEAAAAGFARKRLPASAERASPLLVALEPVPGPPAGRAAFGALRDRALDPVGGARVILAPHGAEGAAPFAALSDAEGTFRFDAVPAGTFDLLVRAPGFAPFDLPSLGVPAGEGPWDLGTAFLEPGEAIEGRVVDDAGLGVEAARVRVVSEEAEKGRTSPQAEAAVSTDEEGRFVLVDRAAGTPCRLEVSASGFTPRLVPGVVPPTLEPITVVLRRAGELAGTVLSAEGPVEGAVVVAEIAAGSPLAGRRFYTASDASGRFLLQDVEPGGLSLRASAEGYGEGERIPLTLAAGERRAGLEIRLTAGGSVAGSVSSRSGAPVAEAVVEAFSEGGGGEGAAPRRRSAVSDQAGRFRLEGLQPGTWIFTATHPDFVRKVARQAIGAGGTPLILLLEPGAEVAGIVTDDAGRPLAGARVALSQTGGGASDLSLLPPVPERAAVSRADGSFRLLGVEDGSYLLRAEKSGFARGEPEEPIALSGAPVEGLVLRLRRGSAIRGRLLGLPASRLAQLEVFAFQAEGRGARGEVEPTGGYRIPDLAPGRWQVVADVEATGERAAGEVLVGEEPATLDLDFGAGRTEERPQHDRSGLPEPSAAEVNQPTRPPAGPRI